MKHKVAAALVAPLSMVMAALGTAGMAVAEGPTVPPDVAASVKEAKSGIYIVVMKDRPAIAYTGGINGLPATKPTGSEKLLRTDRDVIRYVDYLEARQDQAMRSAGVAPSSKLASYSYAANGFAAELTGTQVERLRLQPSVALVVEDSVHSVQSDRRGGPTPTSSSAQFLGLTDRRGAWASGLTGEGVVVGVIDTGIWPEHPSLSPVGFGPYSGAFAGSGCDFGNGAFNAADAAFSCNNKLLAAKSYGSVFHGGTGAGLTTGEFLSARDADGHGTHTATTAAGNKDVPASIFGISKGTTSGIAPRARVSVYKACWSSPDGDGCSGGDLADAIDDAVADGVDVINYSIGSDTPGFSLDSLEFLFAFDAGIFVSVSAGNAGPGADTVGSPAVSTWVTAVGASTTDRTFESVITLGNGKKYRGASVTAGAGPAQLVDAADLGNDVCDPDVAFSAPVTGDIVLCVRGGVDRIAKSKAVAAAGGAGMILYNPLAAQGTVTDNHFVPSSHVSLADGTAIKAYIASAGAGATATLAASASTYTQGSVMGDFSSRGQNLFVPDVLKPDVTAPGVNILAGNTPANIGSSPGELFQSISGTSMSSPHVAGLYALLKQAHPDWSASGAKSALMTTARQDVKKEDGATKADPFDMGAGHVDPSGDVRDRGSLFNPGLVYDSNIVDHLVASCDYFPVLAELFFGVGCDVIAAAVPAGAEDLNLASISNASVVGVDSMQRTLTNVSASKIKVEAEVKAPKGFKVKVTPSQLTIPAGESRTFTVTVTRTKAAFGEWSFGSLTWEGNGYEVRSPLSLRAVEFAAPAEVSGTGSTGSTSIDVQFGYTGPFSASAIGLAPGAVESTSVVQGDAGFHGPITVAAGTALLRVVVSGAELTSDLDLYVFDADFNLVGLSADGDSDESVDLVAPAAGDYFVIVDGFATDGDGTPYDLTTFVVPDAAGSLSVSAPATATASTSGSVVASWSGLAPGSYLGVVTHTGPSGVLATTIVAVDVP